MKDSKLKRKLVAAYEVFYEYRRIFILRTKYRLHIMSPEKTLKYIKRNKCSIARYGDGEFELILNLCDEGFQNRSPELSEKLTAVFRNHNKKLLICIPRCMNTTRECNDFARTHWIEWGKRNNTQRKIVKLIRKMTGKNYLFGDSQITRPYIDWKNNSRADRTFPMLKELWADRDVMIVEGTQTRLGVGNDLLNGASTVKRILAPAVGAFEQYEQIKQTVLEHYHGELVIMALGPTATILAEDLTEKGIQALDIGHIDIEYEWYLQKTKTKTAISGKFTNEAKNGRVFTECTDVAYLDQIVAKIDS